ncbi:MAG TPA: hypothetical protein VJ755_04180 [Gemmatimonadales bacterium]|nr:hypothetical protein [Gemmatimonadales bacterium]
MTAVILTTTSLGAQDRPRLPAAADTNDWEAYYDQGIEWLNRRLHHSAEAAFYWSSRLNPRRAEPLFARWAVAWSCDAGQFGRYLNHDADKPLPPEMARIDSLRSRALLRNPLVFQGLIIAAFQELPGRWREDAWTDAWLAYSALDFKRALSLFVLAERRNPQRFGEVRYLRATTFVALNQLDSAAAELGVLLDTLRRREQEQFSDVYASKAFVLYAVGLVEAGRRQFTAARGALENALVEDLSFYPAHLVLGHLATERRDAAAALKEYEEAAAGGPDDAVARFEYGAALVRAHRPAEAAAELQAAVALEPYFADPYYWLGEARLAQRDSAAALQAFQSYAARAPTRSPELVLARQRLSALAHNKEE